MKNKYLYKKIIIGSITFGTLFFAGSCTQDLEREPTLGLTSSVLYKDFSNYKPALAKIYAGLAIGGQGDQNNGDANTDIGGIDGGFSNYLRQMYSMQVLTTDEAVIAWADAGLPEMHSMTWNASNPFVAAIYYRIFNVIAVSNEFIKNTTDEKLSSNGITGNDLTEAKYMRAEARFLRAQSYYHALDLFGNVPYVTETTDIINTPPPRIVRAELFKYVESELLACANELKDAKTNEYGRADKAAAWSLLARLYLNAQVYTGTARYTDCITYCNKVINAGYSLKTNYASLFMADNNVNNPEVILSVNYDGISTRTYGGSTFMVHAAVGGSMPASQFGINGGWGGLRTTKAFVNLFTPNDQRGNFYTSGQNLEINNVSTFTDGYAFIKYKNIKFSDGKPGSDASGDFVDSDIPLYRLADIYLMYGEAVARGGSGGSAATALGYVNALRTRAGANTVGSINTDFFLDERARELSWEATRRTDLIRYGKFTSGSYLWPWKGGVKDGKAVEDYRSLFPIPANDIVANPNLVQNPGY
ncbi:RagB/SusD family nutrient uptake outer membrane protein [Chryseobacterium salviniae]|uniref:RagB/SusD family nutrient uptake outer membrane protein n=1 Tax=Chryseobacterium salviniae TaxID=3101750 RepID=A0ABU6HUU2_9FLAO|nr:RagB/SusD family nutrient uptake outer membrane protein [Chryseobacterium sp. T9W2-O]MEC3876827.1 RagB/SusD family nutrient uptake outer membrane protein [Chryseobacterium sp. T9W2-O]